MSKTWAIKKHIIKNDKMKTPQQVKNEVEKGCGKVIRREFFGNQRVWICGIKDCFYNDEEVPLCDSCKAKLSILTEYNKSIKEMIEDELKPKDVIGMTKREFEYFKEGKRIMQNLDFTDGFRQGRIVERKYIREIITKWRIQLEDEGFITVDKHFVDELLSKIGDNSEVEK